MCMKAWGPACRRNNKQYRRSRLDEFQAIASCIYANFADVVPAAYTAAQRQCPIGPVDQRGSEGRRFCWKNNVDSMTWFTPLMTHSGSSIKFDNAVSNRGAGHGENLIGTVQGAELVDRQGREDGSPLVKSRGPHS